MRLKFQTYEFETSEIHVRTLRDRQEFHDPLDAAKALGISSANWSLFGVVWDSGQVLAQMMWRRANTNERILEIGCGIGLASLALAMRQQNITATDRHPDAQEFLAFNSQLNDLPMIPFERCSWEQPASNLGRFDLIIGSDLLYEQTSLERLSGFIAAHAKPKCELLLVDPGRGLRGKFTKHMTALGFRCEARQQIQPPDAAGYPHNYKGCVLRLGRG